MRLGLVTQRDVAVNDTIIAIPLRLVMDAASARSVPKIATVLDDLNVRCVSWSSTRLCAAARVRPSPRFALTRPRRHAPAAARALSYPDTEDAHHALLYLLLHEARVVGDASRWAHYLRTLPTERDLRQALPAFFDESLVAELEPSELAADILRYQAHLHASFALVRERVFARFPAIFPPAKCDFDAYRWAHLVLDTRATWWGGQVHLLPMRDFVNTRERITVDRDDRVWGVFEAQSRMLFRSRRPPSRRSKERSTQSCAARCATLPGVSSSSRSTLRTTICSFSTASRRREAAR